MLFRGVAVREKDILPPLPPSPAVEESMGISIASAEILALFLESLVYGIFFCLYWVVIFVVVVNPRKQRLLRVNVILITVASAMLLLASAHLLIDLVRAFHGFNGSIQMEPFFHSVSSGTFLAKSAIWILQTILGDGVLIWRCYVVFGRRVKYIVPMLLGAVLYVCSGCAIMYNFSHYEPGTSSVFTGQFRKWILLYFCSTMYINLMCTGAMAWHIVKTTRPLQRTGSIAPVLVAIIDTAALYTAGYTGLLVSFLVNSDGQFAAVDVIIPLIGVTFSLIILQIRSHGVHSQPNWNTNSAVSMDRRQYTLNPQLHSMQPISVEIIRETEVEFDEVSDVGSKAKSLPGSSGIEAK